MPLFRTPVFIIALLLSACGGDEHVADNRLIDEQLLRLAGASEGQRVLDVFSGGGHYSEMLAEVVGPGGALISWNNAFFLRLAADEREERALASRFGQVEEVGAEIQDFDWPVNLDLIVMTTVFHDLWVPRIVGEEYDAVTPVISGMFKSLKPGGRVLIVDHVAPEGLAADRAADLHRIEPSYVVALFAGAGFELESTSDILRNDSDNYEVSIFNKAVRGRTDRFVHVYRKPLD